MANLREHKENAQAQVATLFGHSSPPRTVIRIPPRLVAPSSWIAAFLCCAPTDRPASHSPLSRSVADRSRSDARKAEAAACARAGRGFLPLNPAPTAHASRRGLTSRPGPAPRRLLCGGHIHPARRLLAEGLPHPLRYLAAHILPLRRLLLDHRPGTTRLCRRATVRRPHRLYGISQRRRRQDRRGHQWHAGSLCDDGGDPKGDAGDDQLLSVGEAAGAPVPTPALHSERDHSVGSHGQGARAERARRAPQSIAVGFVKPEQWDGQVPAWHRHPPRSSRRHADRRAARTGAAPARMLSA